MDIMSDLFPEDRNRGVVRKANHFLVNGKMAFKHMDEEMLWVMFCHVGSIQGKVSITHLVVFPRQATQTCWRRCNGMCQD